MSSKINLNNIVSYIVGNLRYKLYYSRLKCLLRTHIVEQIDYRIFSMDRDCYNQGQCKMCGCQTTALQMANKACDKPCYPKMVDKVTWEGMKKGTLLIDKSSNVWKITGDRKFKNLNTSKDE